MENREDLILVIEYLEDTLTQVYGSFGQDVYNNLYDIFKELEEFKNNNNDDLNELSTDARVYYIDILDTLKEEV